MAAAQLEMGTSMMTHTHAALCEASHDEACFTPTHVPAAYACEVLRVLVFRNVPCPDSCCVCVSVCMSLFLHGTWWSFFASCSLLCVLWRLSAVVYGRKSARWSWMERQ